MFERLLRGLHLRKCPDLALAELKAGKGDVAELVEEAGLWQAATHIAQWSEPNYIAGGVRHLWQNERFRIRFDLVDATSGRAEFAELILDAFRGHDQFRLLHWKCESLGPHNTRKTCAADLRSIGTGWIDEVIALAEGPQIEPSKPLPRYPGITLRSPLPDGP